MTMTDLRPTQFWAAFEQQMFDRFQLNGRVYDNKGFTFTGHVTWCNELCPAIKGSPEGVQAICSVAHQALAAQAASGHAIVAGECDAGLSKFCCPIEVDGELVGIIGGCGRLAPSEEVDEFLVETSTAIPKDTVHALANTVTAISSQTAAEVVAYLEDVRKDVLGAK